MLKERFIDSWKNQLNKRSIEIYTNFMEDMMRYWAKEEPRLLLNEVDQVGKNTRWLPIGEFLKTVKSSGRRNQLYCGYMKVL
jgi:hypothetical protein